MRDVLRIAEAGNQIHSSFRWLTRELNCSIRRTGGELRTANGLWIQSSPDYEISKELRDIVGTNYDASIRQVDFDGSPKKATEEINRWVEEATHGKISALISARDVKRYQWMMAIVNAVYFKSMWAIPFDASRTREGSFTLGQGSRIEVPMMHNSSRDYRYMEQPAFQALEMPYRGLEFSMIVFLPRTVNGLEEFEKSLTHENLSNWCGKLSTWALGVEVSIPRMKIRSRLRLAPILLKMGMTSAFGPKADFSGLLKKKRPGEGKLPMLLMGSVLQEVCIEVTEKGTEASAATAVPLLLLADGPKVFRADHPFVFIIYHKPTNCILFMGRVIRPEPPRSTDRSSNR